MRQPFTQINIKIGKWFVQKQQTRPGCQSPGQSYALLLST